MLLIERWALQSNRIDIRCAAGDFDDVFVDFAELFVRCIEVADCGAERIAELKHVGVVGNEVLAKLLDVLADFLGVFVNFQ